MTMQSQDIVKRSATTATSPSVRRGVEVAKLIDTTTCIGCKACQVACAEWNDLKEEIGDHVGVYENPLDLTANTWTLMRFAEVEPVEYEFDWLIRKDGCLHCGDPGCLQACPAPGAIVKHANGIVDFVSENCVGCGYCIAGCPFDIPRRSKKDNRVYKCTLCSDRVAVGLEPICVKTCPTGCISFGSKEQMTARAQERVEQLKARGNANAGYYDPEGVGGTHVMYVLKHADKPELYEGLPKDPKIATSIALWSGLKPFTAGLMGLAALGAFVHYFAVGPNEVEDEEEETGKTRTASAASKED